MSYYGAKGGKTVGVKESKTAKVFNTKGGKSDGSSYSASYSASMSNPYNYGDVGVQVVKAKAAKRE